MIQDIPKLYTALAEWLACVLFVRLLPQRYNAAKTAGILAAALPLFGLVQWLIGIVPLSLWIPGIQKEIYKEWEGFRRSWHCRKIQKFRFSHNAYLLVFGSE